MENFLNWFLRKHHYKSHGFTVSELFLIQGRFTMSSNMNSISNSTEEKAHSWRICPIGKHFVREHIVHVHPSKKHPEGIISTRHEHCANNPSHKDELSYHEIKYISETYFSELTGPPTAGRLSKTFSEADNYDHEIRGWVRYWNDIFQPTKALIGTESGFSTNPAGSKSAFGLMQIKNETFEVLQNPKGELTNYLIRTPRNKLLDPSVNICMGVRWLFQKRKLAGVRLNREASWEEAIIEYKSYWKDFNDKKVPRGIEHLRDYYEILQGVPE